jgi:hypothetical protein
MDSHEHAALEQRYQQLFEQTARIENDAIRRGRKPFQIDPRYPNLCRELEAVTLQLARSHQGQPHATSHASTLR